jgi:hypothetical protein
MDWKSPEIIFYSIAALQLIAVLVAHLLNQYNKNKAALIQA